MQPHRIISRGESLQIPRNDLRKAALEKRAAEPKTANPEKRAEIHAEIGREVEKEIQKRVRTRGLGNVIW